MTCIYVSVHPRIIFTASERIVLEEDVIDVIWYNPMYLLAALSSVSVYTDLE